MKKTLLFGLACMLGLMSASYAQTYITNPKVVNAPSSLNNATILAKPMTGEEANTGLEKSIKGPLVNPYTNQPPVQFGVETIIGITTYDLQSNSSIQDRIMNNGDGTISAVWTYSESFDVAAADRGTGYNFFDGVSWGPQPTSRIEVEKTGWPNIGRTSGGRELFLCHNIAQTFISQGARNTTGTGTWTMSNVTATNQVWNRMAVGGANGQTVHQISLFDPIPAGNPWTNGVQSQLLYWRSQDGGLTNDISEFPIPGLDETNFTFFSGDSYNIAAKGDTVVVVYFGDLAPTVMAKSTDNGTTWTTTVLINVFPPGVTYDAGSANTTGSVIGISDINGDGTPDTVTATDGAGWVTLDQNGMAHIFFGNMDYIDDTPGDDQWSFFPGTNGMMYWNENFGDRDPVAIGGSMDTDGNGVLDIVGIAAYNQGLSAFPSAGIDANGCIYVSYSAVMENMDQGSQNYRHIYITKSCDNGCSWVDPVDVTPGSGFEENVYASMARNVDANINIVWQRDFEPGIAVNGDEDAFVSNDIVHASIPVTDINTAAVVCIGWVDGDSLFCSGDSVLLSATCGNSWSWSTGETTQSIYYKGAFGAVTVDITTDCGVLAEVINVSAPSAPPTISVTSSTVEMCDGDQAMLMVTSNAGGIISWSTGASTAGITVDSVGTYIVTVTNCGGVAVDSIVIAAPNNPPTFVVSATKPVMCNGDSSSITASAVSQGTILWSTGDTTWTISTDSIGTYSATVTNCGGITTESITIVLPAPPAAVINGNSDFCSGDSIVLTAGSEPSATYAWSTGDSTQSITVLTQGSFTVTVTNCGGSDNVSVTTNYFGSPLLTVSPGDLEFCENIGTNSVVISAFAFGADPFIYVWSNGDTIQALTLETVAQSGVYSVTAIDVCGATAVGAPDTVIILPSPTADTVSVTSVTVFGLNDGAIDATVTGGTLPYVYSWDTSPIQTNEDATALFGDDTYTLTVTDANGCTGTTQAFVPQPPNPVGIADVNIGTFSIHPNPNNGRFVVNLKGLYDEVYTFEIRNIIGQTVYAETFNGQAVSSVDLNLTESNKGVYFLTISNSRGKRTEKLIVQ